MERDLLEFSLQKMQFIDSPCRLERKSIDRDVQRCVMVEVPEMGSNRRRRPFQGCLSESLSGLKSSSGLHFSVFTRMSIGLVWA